MGTSDTISGLQELMAFGVLISYFLLILASFGVVFWSILDGVPAKRLLDGRPFLFLRIAVAALGCTWFYMIKFMLWSYETYQTTFGTHSVGSWLYNTALFEQAWKIVCDGPSNWWWSSFICTWSVISTPIIWRESIRRGIRFPWAYMLLGMSVAISVSTSLFITACFLHPRKTKGSYPTRAPPSVYIPIWLSFHAIYTTPSKVQTPTFLSNLLWMHAFLLVPLIIPHQRQIENSTRPSMDSLGSVPFSSFYPTTVMIALGIHIQSAVQMLAAKSDPGSVWNHLLNAMFSHPAQSSISMDVCWSAFAIIVWFLVTGSTLGIALKLLTLIAVTAGIAIKIFGVDWALVLSITPILLLLGVGAFFYILSNGRSRNEEKRKALMDRMGLKENTVEPGTKDKPPSKVGKKFVIGFWHPYCNAGGGGERVLWSAIKYVQKTRLETICLVYSGDYPTASKEAILGKAKDRFSIEIDPRLVEFIPLKSRYLISETYWPRFTLLGQSLGSIYLAWEGLCGSQGIWGDIFIDTMGHAFTYPFVRLAAGSEITIATYTHYPTVSNDMIGRIKRGEMGVESGFAQGGFMKKQAKLLYYRFFTSLYAVSLLFAENIMTNSTWTNNHIKDLLSSGKSSFLGGIFLMDDATAKKRQQRGDQIVMKKCEIVYPPCDVKSLVGLKLDGRERMIVSLAQFRPEKDQKKQLVAMKKLFDDHPALKKGGKKVTLKLMGGVRDDADEARLNDLKELARTLDIQDNVEFLVNAPYAAIVEQLGKASVGLNTMQDEHFGINVVEFMAAGLIPIVHESAGPKMDIVVPYKSQGTGYHATTAESFAAQIHTALNLPQGEQLKIREAARKAAVEKFSNEEFERGWGAVLGDLEVLVRDRSEQNL